MDVLDKNKYIFNFHPFIEKQDIISNSQKDKVV